MDSSGPNTRCRCAHHRHGADEQPRGHHCLSHQTKHHYHSVGGPDDKRRLRRHLMRCGADADSGDQRTHHDGRRQSPGPGRSRRHERERHRVNRHGEYQRRDSYRHGAAVSADATPGAPLRFRPRERVQLLQRLPVERVLGVLLRRCIEHLPGLTIAFGGLLRVRSRAAPAPCKCARGHSGRRGSRADCRPAFPGYRRPRSDPWPPPRAGRAAF